MMSFASIDDDPLPEAQRIEHFKTLAQEATTAEELARILIRAGWGIGPGDPPIEHWPAFRMIVPILQEILTRAKS